jgi:hypothetical protein
MGSAPHDDLRVLASFDLAGCERRGRVLDAFETDRAVERRFLAGWRNLLTPSLGRIGRDRGSSLFILVSDAGRPALEWTTTVPALLAAGDATWADYEARGVVRPMVSWTFPYFHDEATHDHQAWIGLAFRIQDSRRHYFAGFVGGRDLVIAARDDANWITLNRLGFSADMRRYYRLAVRCKGDRISLSVDGEEALCVCDGRWAAGGAGLYSNSVSRWASVEVVCPEADAARVEARVREKNQGRREALTSAPPARVFGEVPLPLRPGESAEFVDLARGDDLILIRASGGVSPAVLALDRSGREVWRRDFPGDPAGPLLKSEDVDADGRPEVVVIAGSQMLVLEGQDGRVRRSIQLPEGCPYIRLRGERMKPYGRCPLIWRTAGKDLPARIFLFESTGAGGHTIWSFDHDLRLRWRHLNDAGRFGHNLAACDVDGDGRQEVVAGYYALDDDGREVWGVKDRDLIFKQDHTDNLYAGPLEDGGPPRVVAACGEAGALFLDGRNGEVLARLRGLGHMQRLVAGRFLPGEGGVQVWMWTDWGSPGIYYLFDKDARVRHRMQPDPRLAVGLTVAWQPGGDLLLMQGVRGAQGLWDGQGRMVVDLCDTPAVPQSLRPTETGLPVCAPFRVCRFSGDPTDRVLAVDGGRLLVFGPAGEQDAPR